jgi:nicotinamidase-related amidase
MDVRLSSTALLFVETQNEFMHPAGVFHEPILPVARRNGCFGNLVELARRARGQILLAYAPISFAPGHPELAGRCGVLVGVKTRGALERGSFGARIFSDMQPEPSDLAVEARPGISAFHESGLDARLRERGVRRLAVAGFLTNVCVESTVRSAYDYGYEVLVVHDATACNSIEEQTFCETRILPYFADVISTRDFLTEVGQAIAAQSR